MKQCKNCQEMYDHPHLTSGMGKFRLYGDYCPHCGSFNSGFDKYQIIGFLVFILIGLIIYLTNTYSFI
jgi:hypothetical protein|tara:strand:- start:870 stop:1073 length:204 start_codon:yes stop_codon:yes gene_type:complete